jgi:hypothetical protein
MFPSDFSVNLQLLYIPTFSEGRKGCLRITLFCSPGTTEYDLQYVNGLIVLHALVNLICPKFKFLLCVAYHAPVIKF